MPHCWRVKYIQFALTKQSEIYLPPLGPSHPPFLTFLLNLCRSLSLSLPFLYHACKKQWNDYGKIKDKQLEYKKHKKCYLDNLDCAMHHSQWSWFVQGMYTWPNRPLSQMLQPYSKLSYHSLHLALIWKLDGTRWCWIRILGARSHMKQSLWF